MSVAGYLIQLRISAFRIHKNMKDVGHIGATSCSSLGAPASIQRTAAFSSASNLCAIFVSGKQTWNACGAPGYLPHDIRELRCATHGTTLVPTSAILCARRPSSASPRRAARRRGAGPCRTPARARAEDLRRRAARAARHPGRLVDPAAVLRRCTLAKHDIQGAFKTRRRTEELVHEAGGEDNHVCHLAIGGKVLLVPRRIQGQGVRAISESGMSPYSSGTTSGCTVTGYCRICPVSGC